MAADLARLGIVVDSSQVMTANTALGTMQARSVGVQGALQGMGRTAQRIGGMMSTFITAPLVAAGAAAGKFSSDMQDSLAQARAQADLTSQEISFIGDSAEEIAIRTGESTDEIIEAYKFTTSAGLDLAESQELVGVAAEASAAGFGTQRNLVRLTTTALQAYDHQLDSSREFMDLLVGSAQAMELEVSKLGPAVQRNVGIAKELGIGLEQLMGGIGSVSEIMGDAQRGGNMFQTMLSKILKPTAEAQGNIAEIYGSLENFHEAIREDGLLQTLVSLRKRLEETGGGMEDVFTGQEGLEAALNFTNREGARTIEILEDMGITAGSVKDAFEDSATFTRLLARSWEALKATLRPIGNIILESIRPMLANAIPMMQEWRDQWNTLSDHTQQTAIKIAGLIGLGGPILLAVGTLTTVLGAISWPAVLGVGAIGAAAATIIDNWEEVEHYFTEGEGAKMWETTKQIIIEFKDTAVQLWDEFGDDIITITKESFTIVSATISTTLDGVLKLMRKFNGNFDTELNIWEDNWLTTLDKIDGKIVNIVTGSLSNMTNVLRETGRRGYNIFLAPWVDMFTQAESKVDDTQKNTSDSVQQMLADTQEFMQFLRMDFGSGTDMQAPEVSTSFESMKDTASNAKKEVDEVSESIGDMPELKIGGIEPAEGSIADLQMRMRAFRNMKELVDPQSEAFDTLTQSISETREEINRLTGQDGGGFSRLQQAIQSIKNPLENFLGTALSEMAFFEERTMRVRNEFGEWEEQTYTLEERLGDLFKSLLKELTQTITKLLIIKPLMNSLYSAINLPVGNQQSGWTNGSPTAMAGMQSDALVTSSGKIVPFSPEDSFMAMKDFTPLVEGARASGGAKVNVNVINKSNSEVEIQERRSPGGGVEIDAIIRNTVKKGMNEGRFDGAFRRNFGVSRKGRRG